MFSWIKVKWRGQIYDDPFHYDPDAPVPWKYRIWWVLWDIKRIVQIPFWYAVGPFLYSKDFGRWWFSYDDRQENSYNETCPHCGAFVGDWLYHPKFFKCLNSGHGFNGEVSYHYWGGEQTCPRCNHVYEVDDQDA